MLSVITPLDLLWQTDFSQVEEDARQQKIDFSFPHCSPGIAFQTALEEMKKNNTIPEKLVNCVYKCAKLIFLFYVGKEDILISKD